MKIGFCFNLRDDFHWVPDGPADQWGDWDVSETINHIRSILEGLGHSVLNLNPNLIIGCKKRSGIDSILSICEMTGGPFRESIVPTLCELENIPYFFSTPDVLHNTLDKNVANFLAMQCGLHVSSWVNFESKSVLHSRSIERLNTPLIIKPTAEGSGMGMSHPRTLSFSKEDAIKQVELLQMEYGGGALVQEFVSGREFTVGVVEIDGICEALWPIEVLSKTQKERFVYNYEAKENAENLVEFRPLRDEPQILKEIQDAAKIIHTKFNCREVSRIDFRYDDREILHFIELNALPHLHPEIGDFCRSATAAGYDYTSLWNVILSAFKLRCEAQYGI